MLVIAGLVYHQSIAAGRVICFDEGDAFYPALPSTYPSPTSTLPATITRVAPTPTPFPSATRTTIALPTSTLNNVFKTATTLAASPTQEVGLPSTLPTTMQVRVVSNTGVKTRTCIIRDITSCTLNPAGQWLNVGVEYSINTNEHYCFSANIGGVYYWLVKTNAGWAAYQSINGDQGFLTLVNSNKQEEFLSYCLL